MCRLSIPALRHYDELGLLPPAAVDPDTGYRYYSMAQAIDAERIRTLRFLEMPLPEIRALLAGDPDGTRSLLEGHRQRLAEQAERQRYAIALLDSMLRDDPPAAYEVRLRETVPQMAAAIRGRAAWAEIGPFVAASLRDVFKVAGDQGVRFAGPPYAIYHHADSSEAEVELEVGMPVAEQVDAAGRVVASIVPGGLVAATVHSGRYEDVGPAYRALAEWISDHGHETSGPPREMYLVGPDQVQDLGALRTEIAWPVR
jgi:effector-binding domain-containing protein